MIQIRPFNSDDAITFHRWYHDERLSHFYRGFIYGASVSDCEKAPDVMRGHVFVMLKDDEYLGALTLADIDRVLRVYRLGMLTDPEHQHQGVAKTLLNWGLRWAFDKMNAHKVVVEVMASDERTVQGTRAAGFIQEGLKRKQVYLDGCFHDELLFGMLQEDYRKV